MHKNNYLENVIQLQTVISPEGLKLQTCNLLRNYIYSISVRLSSPQCIASTIAEFSIVVINTTSTWRVEGGWGATKWWLTTELSYLPGEMAHKEVPLHSNCHKT